MATTYGVTDQGFALKRLSDILGDMVAALSTVVDETTGETLTPDLTDENDPLVQVVNSFADSLAVAWEQLQVVYNQFDPLAATGAGLSGLVQLNGLTRLAGTRSTVELTLTGTPGTIIPAGSMVSPVDLSTYWSLPLTTIGGGGTATATATATTDGAVTALAGTLVKITTPISGWSGVTNALAASVGTAEETDAELRLRQRYSTSAPARAVVESLYAAIKGLLGVTFCKIYQNETLTLDPDRGIGAKSVAAVVVGGSEEEIAHEIFNRLPLGCSTHGSTSVTIYDEQTMPYTIRFSRPTAVPIHVAVDVEVVNPSIFPSNGSDLIKAAIVTFAEQGLGALAVNGSGYNQVGYLPGDSVYANDLIPAIYSVPGIRVVSISLSLDESDSLGGDGSWILIQWNELAEFSADRITVS